MTGSTATRALSPPSSRSRDWERGRRRGVHLNCVCHQPSHCNKGQLHQLLFTSRRVSNFRERHGRTAILRRCSTTKQTFISFSIHLIRNEHRTVMGFSSCPGPQKFQFRGIDGLFRWRMLSGALSGIHYLPVCLSGMALAWAALWQLATSCERI